MKIISFGDKIKNGLYQKHSLFTHFGNYISSDKKILGISNNLQLKSPINIILDNFVSFEKIEVNDNFIIFDNQAVKKINFYNSELNFSQNFSLSSIEENLKKAKVEFLKNSTKKSLAFIFDREKSQNFSGAFEKAFVQKFVDFDQKFKNEKDILLLKEIKGCGFGFTPSGDDFICGFLFALFLGEKIYNFNFSIMREKIFQNCQRENVIINQFLFLAKEGYFFEKLKLFIENLFEKEIDFSLLENFLNYGFSSGEDLFAGFLYAFENMKVLH